MQTLASLSSNPLARQRLFRALHSADPVTRRALILLAQGHGLPRVAARMACHPRLLQRRLAAFAERLELGQAPTDGRGA